jgi:hypothetical protein
MTKYIVKKEDITPVLEDFRVFCLYLEREHPKLSAKRGELNKKDLFTINSLLLEPKAYDKPTNVQDAYPTINLLFYLALESGLFVGGPGDEVMPLPLLYEFRALNPFSQYLFLFETYRNLELNKIVPEPSYMRRKLSLEKVLWLLRSATPSHPVVADVEPHLESKYGYAGGDLLLEVFLETGVIIHQLHLFGLYDYEEVFPVEPKNREIWVKSVAPTAFGMAMAEICLKQAREGSISLEAFLYGRAFRSREEIEQTIRQYESKETIAEVPILEAVEAIFPAGSLDDLKSLSQPHGNTYLFRVSLGKGTWRKVLTSASHTLEDLHHAIQRAFEFDDDHLYAFFLGRFRDDDSTYYCPRYEEGYSTAEVKIGELGLRQGQVFTYLFDFGDEWIFKIKLEEIRNTDLKFPYPRIVESKGEAPQQYPNWDDE